MQLKPVAATSSDHAEKGAASRRMMMWINA
jgi:hypothetical protein